MTRLSPRQIESLASRICGGEEPFEYRTGAQLEGFFAFCDLPTDGVDGSRFGFTAEVLRRANQDALGPEGLPTGVLRAIEALLDRREFNDDRGHADACDDAAELLRPAGILLERSSSGVEIRSATRSRSATVLDRQIHTIFGRQLDDDALSAARVHYRKAERYRREPSPDYENSCKESVCAIESIVLALTGGADLVKALRKLSRDGVVPPPLAEMVIKLYAYRGAEPGVSHGGPDTPAVGPLEAELLFNLAGAFGAYFRERLTQES